MSRIGASARRYYSDGITRVTDPFWKLKCNKCGNDFLSCIFKTGKKSSSAAVIRIEGYEQVTDFVYKILPDFYITAETADLQVLSYMFSVCY